MQTYVRFTTPANISLDAFPQRGAWPMLRLERLQSLLPLLERYEPISLAQTDSVALMSRTDTKYVISMPQLRALLASLSDDYRMLKVEGVRLNHYRTLYFDTQDLELYYHMGRSERYKVRSRAYLDSGVSFLEVKHRTSKGLTVKARMSTDGLLTQLRPEASRFVYEHMPRDACPLQAALWNEFSRITLPVSGVRLARVGQGRDLHRVHRRQLDGRAQG